MFDSTGVSRRTLLSTLGLAGGIGAGRHLLAGSGSEEDTGTWRQWRHDAGRTNFGGEADPPTDGATAAWRVSTPVSIQKTGTPNPRVLVSNGTVYTAGGDVIDLQSGERLGRSACLADALTVVAPADTQTGDVPVAELTTGTGDVAATYGSLSTEQTTLLGYRQRPDLGRPGACHSKHVWASRDAEGPGSVGYTLLSNGTLFAQAAETLAIDTDDGQIERRLDVAPVCADAERLYTLEEEPDDTSRVPARRLTVHDRDTGERLGRVETHPGSRLHAAADGVAVLTDYGHDEGRAEDPHAPKLVAVDAATGDRRWSVDADAHVDNVPYVDRSRSTVMTGFEKQRRDAPQDAFDDESHPFSPLSAAGGIEYVTVGPETVYAALVPGTVVAVDRGDGTVQWTAQITPVSGMVGTPSGVYVTSSDAIVCLNPATGERRWRFADADGDTYHEPLAVGSRLLVPTTRGDGPADTLLAVVEA